MRLPLFWGYQIVDLTFHLLEDRLHVLQKKLIEEMNSLAAEEWSLTLEKRRIDILVRYLVGGFLFLQMGLKISASLMAIKGVEEFLKYSWPKSMHKFLHGQLNELRGRSAHREAGKNLGYFEGCSVVLLISMAL
ncbi:hypothetical protein KSP39_PZI017172 [Platanthera zijinensis]|uniref:Uncharacterized protein n=1 Tax=Platanthera zijinensis TaxID=2320716 RepID=A0AAP0G004_9ASPA